MSDLTPLSDVAARLQALKAQAEAVDVASEVLPARFVVATNWSAAAVPLAVLKAYQAAFAPDSGAELCFATPHEPGEADAECVRVLIDGVGGGGALAAVTVESFDEAVGKAYDAACVPSGDGEMLISEVAGLIIRMFDVARREDGTRAAGTNAGSVDALKRRFDEFAA